MQSVADSAPAPPETKVVIVHQQPNNTIESGAWDYNWDKYVVIIPCVQ